MNSKYCFLNAHFLDDKDITVKSVTVKNLKSYFNELYFTVWLFSKMFLLHIINILHKSEATLYEMFIIWV